VFSNIYLKGGDLQYSLRKPFDLYAKATDIGEWCALDDSPRWQRPAIKKLVRIVAIEGHLFGAP
jgi:hypothetical protein